MGVGLFEDVIRAVGGFDAGGDDVAASDRAVLCGGNGRFQCAPEFISRHEPIVNC